MDDNIMSLEEILQDPYYLDQYNQRIKNLTDGSLNTELADGHKTEVNMDDNTNPNTPAQGTPTAQQPDTTPQQAATVDINAIITQAEQKAAEAAEKKMEGVFKSMLQQQGLDAEA